MIRKEVSEVSYPDNGGACKDGAARSPLGVSSLKSAQAAFQLEGEGRRSWTYTFELNPALIRLLAKSDPSAFRELATAIGNTDEESLRGGLPHVPQTVLMDMAVQLLKELRDCQDWQRDAGRNERSAVERAIDEVEYAMIVREGCAEPVDTEVEAVA